MASRLSSPSAFRLLLFFSRFPGIPLLPPHLRFSCLFFPLHGYIVGKPIDGTYEFQPQATATRAEVATIFRAFCMANPTVLKK